jgi:hypothetical protein
MFSWLDWIINEGLPFSTVEKPLTRQYSNLSPISVETFMKAMHEATLLVEKKIKELLPDKFALVFDGWTLDGTSSHFIGIFATFSGGTIFIL